jgi:hypothetical protein
MLKTEMRLLPAYWASYLINGDASGMTEHDRKACDAYLAREGVPTPVDCTDAGFCRGSDAYPNIGGDCCEFTFLIEG